MGTLIELQDLRKYFPIESGFIKKVHVDLKAVDGVSFRIDEGETFGLVGESGCGKTTIGKVLLKLYEVTSGKIIFRDKDVTYLRGSSLNEYRKNIQAVFQNPYASLNPRMRIWRLIGEPLIVKGWSTRKVKEKVAELLELVMLPADCGSRFPHELSAGQRQQIAIARALSIDPKFIVLDEPTSLLDVSAQASILNMIVNLQKKLELTYLFISHNLAVVRFLSSRVAVMYCGKLVELADSRILYSSPIHPYTQALLASVPAPDPDLQTREIVLEGDVTSPINPPSGCRFYMRCQENQDGCKENEPPLLELKPGHFVACHRRSS
ncbi:MAG: ABC transporter ATP-binding protein [Deltaproteobacteria bacterium]|nr:ABC transporter ATP-binding protein [Deltaproteobacteria bacterium]